MTLGVGKYDELATYVREQADALGVMVLVVEGNRGSGFVHHWKTRPGAAPFMILEAARSLHKVAFAMEKDADELLCQLIETAVAGGPFGPPFEGPVEPPVEQKP